MTPMTNLTPTLPIIGYVLHGVGEEVHEMQSWIQEEYQGTRHRSRVRTYKKTLFLSTLRGAFVIPNIQIPPQGWKFTSHDKIGLNPCSQNLT